MALVSWCLRTRLMISLFGVSRYDGYFVDLFVRVSNSVAIGMYEKLGYSVYRRVLGYYSSANDGEDAFGRQDHSAVALVGQSQLMGFLLVA